jgi:hypothetical protein
MKGQRDMLGVLLFVAAGTVALPAFGSEPSPSAGEEATSSRSYAGTTLLVDAISLTHVVILPYVAKGVAVPALGIGGYFLGAPIVHLSHQNGGWRALLSLGLRAGLFVPMTIVAGGFPNHLPYDDDPDETNEGTWLDPDKVATWGIITLPPAMLLDALFLAREPVPQKTTATVTVQLHPVWTKDRAGLSALGTF